MFAWTTDNQKHMQIYNGLPHPPLSQPTALAIGNFDGVHLGHQALLRAMVEAAHRHDRQAGVLTFDPHPIAVLRPQTTALYLTTMPERLRILEALGLDFTVVYPFSQETARTPARQFVADLRRALHLASLWVGPDFALGRDREGNIAALQAMGREMGFEVQVIDPQTLGESEVHSGLIRQHLLDGRVKQAAEMLGRAYEVVGVVVPGAHRGHSIGFPTANLAVPQQRLLPANGVYATWADLESSDSTRLRRWPSVTNIGVRPSFDNGERTVETHLLDFAGDLYGQRLRLRFIRRLRPEMRFSSIAALRAQIQQDIEQAREILTGT